MYSWLFDFAYRGNLLPKETKKKNQKNQQQQNKTKKPPKILP